jgi:hypothetical protein
VSEVYIQYSLVDLTKVTTGRDDLATTALQRFRDIGSDRPSFLSSLLAEGTHLLRIQPGQLLLAVLLTPVLATIGVRARRLKKAAATVASHLASTSQLSARANSPRAPSPVVRFLQAD